MPRGSAAPIPHKRRIQTPAFDPDYEARDHEVRIRALELEPRTANVPPFTIPAALHATAPTIFTAAHPVIHRHRIWQVWFHAGMRVSSSCVANIIAWENPETQIADWLLEIDAGDYVAYETISGQVTVPHLGYFTVRASTSSGDPADWTLGATIYRDE